MLDTAFPVIIDGVHYANFYIGQIFLEAPDLDFFRAQAKEYGFDEQAYLEAVKQVPIWSQDKLDVYLAFIREFTEMIAEVGHKNLKEIEARKIIEDKDIKLQQVYTTLEASEAKYKIVADNTYDWEFWLNPDGQFEYSSPSCERISGHSAQAFIKNAGILLELIHPDDREKYKQSLSKENPGGEENRIEVRIIKPGGEYCWIEQIITQIIDSNGKYFGIRGRIRDITARKKDQDDLVNAERQYRTLTETMKDVVWIMDPETLKFIYISPSFRKHESYKDIETMTASLDNMVPPLMKEPMIKKIRQQKSEFLQGKYGSDHYFTEELELILLDGSSMWAEIISNFYVSQSTGNLEIRGTTRDITPRKIAEIQLRKSEQFIEGILNATPNLIYIYDLINHCNVYANREVLDFLGYDEKEIMEMGSELFNNILHPEDMARVALHHESMKSSPDRFVKDIEYRMKHHDGRWRWLRSRDTVFSRDEKGEATTILGSTLDITEYRNTIDALRESEEKFAALFRLGPVFISLTSAEDGTYIDVNETFLRESGFTRDEVIGHTATEINIYACPDDRARIHKLLNEQESLSGTECNFKAKDGKLLPCLLSKCIVIINDAPCNLTMAIDISDRKKTEELLYLNNERYSLAVKAGSMGVWEWDIQRDQLIWDDHMYRLYGQDDKSISTFETWAMRLHPDDLNRAREESRLAIEGEKEYDTEFRVVLPDGNIRHIKSFARILRDRDGKPTRMIGVNHDISDYRNIEAQILKMNEELEHRVNQRTAQLQVSNQELEAFSYSVSHDLRGPLRSIDGFSALLLDEYSGVINEEGQQYLDTIRANAQKMAHLIDDLLNFSHLSRSDMEHAKIDMTNLATNVFNEIIAIDSNTRIKFAITPLPAATGDQKMIRQVWINLLSNAVKFTSKKANPVISVGSTEIKGITTYFVMDNGVGFDMQYIDKLFGVFQRLHHAADFPGTGVGLAIVHRIIHKHGGKVWAQSIPGEGATFYFQL